MKSTTKAAASSASGTIKASTSSASSVTKASASSTNSTAKASASSPAGMNVTISANATIAAQPLGVSPNVAAAPTAAFGKTGFSTLPQIQADRVQAQGFKGKGIKIAIIDGGVDYTRPALGGCFGPGCKVAGGFDFVGDNYDGSNAPVSDSDPLDLCYSHGSIVAGIIGANDNVYGVPGVAPEASLYVYRVFGCNGATTNALVIEGMQKAYQDGVDIINLSLGEISGWTEGVLSVVASRLVAKGTTVTASAGNSGQNGAFYAFAPGTGQGVINVGSSDNAIIASNQATVSTGHAPIVYNAFQPFNLAPFPTPPNTFLPIYTYNSPNGFDGCTIPSDTPFLGGKIAVVTASGPCTISLKAQNAFIAGATAILVINTPNTAPYIRWFPLIPYGMISPDDGAYLLKAAATGKNPQLKFALSPVAVPNTFTGNTTSYFSNIGPTNDLYMAPSFVAPGTQIISVTPLNPDFFFFNWSITDGTSWSSAFAAGSAALYMNAKGKSGPAAIKSAMELTSTSLPVSRSNSQIESIAAQGSGKLQLFDAVNGGLSVSPYEILLNDTTHIPPYTTINIKNTGKKAQTYRITHVPAGTALTISSAKQIQNQPVPQTGNAANVVISVPTVFLLPGQSLPVIVRFTPPSGLDAATLPVYSGWINIQAQGGSDRVQVPYLGVAAVMKQQPVLDAANQPVIVNSAGQTQAGGAVYSLSGNSYPSVVYR